VGVQEKWLAPPSWLLLASGGWPAQGALYVTDNAAYTWTAAVQETVDATLNRTVSSGTACRQCQPGCSFCHTVATVSGQPEVMACRMMHSHAEARATGSNLCDGHRPLLPQLCWRARLREQLSA
jgi:hypothetical protein